jgi:hypothetical protein
LPGAPIVIVGLAALEVGRIVGVEGNIDHEKLNVALPVDVLVGIKPWFKQGVVLKLKPATGA